jgi:hypothetical protein
MKLLSESLNDLAARAKKLEDTAAAATNASRTALEKRRRDVEDGLESAAKGVETAVHTVHEAGATAHERWIDTSSSITRQVEAMRGAPRRRHDEREVDKARRAAVHASRAVSNTVR